MPTNLPPRPFWLRYFPLRQHSTPVSAHVLLQVVLDSGHIPADGVSIPDPTATIANTTDLERFQIFELKRIEDERRNISSRLSDLGYRYIPSDVEQLFMVRNIRLHFGRIDRKYGEDQPFVENLCEIVDLTAALFCAWQTWIDVHTGTESIFTRKYERIMSLPRNEGAAMDGSRRSKQSATSNEKRELEKFLRDWCIKTAGALWRTREHQATSPRDMAEGLESIELDGHPEAMKARKRLSQIHRRRNRRKLVEDWWNVRTVEQWLKKADANPKNPLKIPATAKPKRGPSQKGQD